MWQRTEAICDTKFEEPADNITELMQLNLSLQGKMETGEFSFPAKQFDDVQLQDLIEKLKAELKGKIASSFQLDGEGGDIGPVQNFAQDPGQLTCGMRPRYHISGVKYVRSVSSFCVSSSRQTDRQTHTHTDRQTH
jgi:hypothetical protein